MEGFEVRLTLATASGIGPAALLNGHGSRFPASLSRVRSPAKTLLNSPAQRNRLIARNSSSPARGAIVRDDSSRSSSQPTANQASTQRRLDFRTVANGGTHSLSQPLAGNRPGAGKGLANGHRLQPLQYSDDDDDEEEEEEEEGEEEEEEEAQSDEGDHGEENDGVDDFIEESMAMLNYGDDYDQPQTELEPGLSEDEEPPAPAAQKKAGQPSKQKAAASAKSASLRGGAAAEEEEEDEQDQQGPTPKPPPGKRGRPAKAGKPPPAPAQPPAHLSKKRRSLDEAGTAGTAPKRQRTSPATKTQTKKNTPAPPAAAAPKPRGRARKPSISDPNDTSQLAPVARRPPLPKSRGLLINRREAPGDPGSSMHRTRSGRTSFKPLAYWRNERVEFDKDEAEDAFAGRTHKSTMVLSRLKEVVRVDEPEPEVRAKSRGGSGGGAKKGRGKKRRRSGGFYEDGEDDDEPAEVWELDPGTVTGEVVVWQPEYEFSPPAPNDLVSVMDKQLAISGPAIKTTAVAGGEFRYAKVFSEGFIGAGVVDLPPGAIKRLKNSRKVFMIFFVHAGRVLVTVQETSFRISKGGIFIVPRCKFYTFLYPSVWRKRRTIC